MNYFSNALTETFKFERECEIFDNHSVITDIEYADVIVMKQWLHNYVSQHIDVMKGVSLHLHEDIVLSKYQDAYVQTLRVRGIKGNVPHPHNDDYHLHRLVLLNNNRICLIWRGNKDYKFDVFVLLNVDRIYESDETIRWLKYKIAFENAPVKLANETNYFTITL